MHLFRAVGALCLLTLSALVLGGCGSSQAKTVGSSTKNPRHRLATQGDTPPALDIVGRTHGSYLGNVAAGVQWSVQAVSMATPSEGWATARNQNSETILALHTLDGGQSFIERYVARDPIVAIATPNASRAYLLENSCSGTGCGSSDLVVTTDGGRTFRTVWQGVALSRGRHLTQPDADATLET